MSILHKFRIKRVVSAAVASILFSAQLFVGILGSGIAYADTLEDEGTTQTQSAETQIEGANATSTENINETEELNTNSGQGPEQRNSQADQQAEALVTREGGPDNSNRENNTNKDPKDDNDQPNNLVQSLVAQENAIIQALDADVTLCHATGSETNPFVVITVDAAGAFNGHLGLEHQLGEDIIPPFTFEGQTYSQNWDAEGIATFNNGCVPVPPVVVDVCPNIEGVQTTIPEGMIKNNAGHCVTPVVAHENVTLCHATGSTTNPFVVITVSAAGAFNGHLGLEHQLGEDIIPPFTFEGQTYSQNWDAEGIATFNNGCVPVPPVIVTTNGGRGGGAVLGASTTQPPAVAAVAEQLVNTGTNTLNTIFAALVLIGLAAATAFSSPKYRSDPGLSNVSY